MMSDELIRLIETHYSKADAQAYREFVPSQLALKQFEAIGLEVLDNFPWIPNACALMSATWAALVRDKTEYPVHQVAGGLTVDGVRVYGDDLENREVASVFSESNLDWDGHSWVAFGEYLGDISIFRTAYSDKAPPTLKEAVIRNFGQGKGLVVAKSAKLANIGFDYVPKYVLSDDKIFELFRGARDVAVRGRI